MRSHNQHDCSIKHFGFRPFTYSWFYKIEVRLRLPGHPSIGYEADSKNAGQIRRLTIGRGRWIIVEAAVCEGCGGCWRY